MLEVVISRPNVLDKYCPSRQVLELIADKWTVLVIYTIAGGVQRYEQIRRTISGISKKMLTQTLRDLERNGLVARKVYAVVPPKVEYTLTPLGQTLVETLRGVCSWAEAHIEEVELAQKRYDKLADEPQNEWTA